MMKPMSESLLELATRVQELEGSAAAARDKNRAALESRHQQLERTIDREIVEFEAAAEERATRAGTWWVETRNSVERQVAAMRADILKHKEEHERDRAERRAELAEEDAAAAMSLAAYCLNSAEWAVVDAALARAEADELAAAH